MSGPHAPIGIFDSGVGGLTVARAIADQLPDERLHYVGDTAHGPYGGLRIADIRRHALQVADELVDGGVKLLVIACNTASAACLADARERYPIPVVEVVRPAVRRAVAVTRSGSVGVIGTRATILSRAYQDAFAAAPHIRVTGVSCPRFVDFVERGTISGRQMLGLAQSYLEPLQRIGVDTLVLGCTHYPLLTGVLQIVMGGGVTLVSSAEETAKDVLRVLTETDLLRTVPYRGDDGEAGASGDAAEPEHRFTATGDPASFARLARRFLGPALVAPVAATHAPD
ncbi:MAG TPA: glutamate racemase [Pseudonocardiaceae bacterium]|nr:glutamate racemase [Pseudonocardiaceae bacterium]